MSSRLERQHWLWVTRPAFYSIGGVDNPDLDPTKSVEWTCGKNTRAGDLALLYRTAPRSDIAYLLEVVSDPYVMWDGEFEGEYLCEATSRAKFDPPLTLKEMKEDPKLLDGFGPLRAQFFGSVFGVDGEWWEHLRSLIAAQDPASEPVFKSLERSYLTREWLSEHEIEDVLERRFASLDPRKGLKLYIEEAHDGAKRSGRQFRCAGLGRIDLLGRDRDGLVVVELKSGLVNKSAVGQILGYMGWVREKLAGKNERVRGILVGRDFDAQAQYALNAIPELSVRFLDELDLSS